MKKTALRLLAILATPLICLTFVVPALADGPGDGLPEPMHVRPDWNRDVEHKPLPFALDREVSPTAIAALQLGDEEWFWADDGWKYFTLMALNDYVEVWVADEAGMSYPPGDPRPPTVVRPEQAEYLAEEFETNIWPSDTGNFGLPTLRDGSEGAYASWGYDWYVTEVPTRTIMLVFNIATDENYYDPTYPSYIIGFYSSDETKVWADRNIIHIDAANWDQYLGPPGKDWGVGEVTDPYEYEATVAHEFQHLIHSDRGQGEDDWIDEGCSEYSEYLAGYKTEGTHGRTGLLNWPENALVLWGDQDDDQGGFEILADYQQVYLWTLRLDHKYPGKIKDLVDEDEIGVAGFEKVYTHTTFMDEFNGFRKELIYGADTDDAWMQAQGWGSAGRPISPTFEMNQILENLDQEGYDKPGAPPYGSDYIKVYPGPGLGVITFTADLSLPPTRWQGVATLPITASGNVSSHVLYSGHSDFDERWIIFDIAAAQIPTGTLSFDTFYNIETGWDYAFVQVTTDTTGMTGWTSLANENTMTETNDSAPATIKNNVPGLSGLSEISPTYWSTQIFDVSAYTGTDILLAFRYAADWGTAGDTDDYPPGWWIDNVKVDDTIVWNGDTFIGGDSLKQTQGWKPDFRVNFFTYDASNPVGWNDVATMTLSTQMTGTLDLGTYLGAGEFGVLAIAGVPPMIQGIMGYGITEYLPYALTGMPASVATSDVTVDFEADDPFAGGLVTYTINFRNTGDVTATVDVTNAIPANTTFVATSGEYSSTLNAVRWLDVEVPPLTLVTGTLTVRIDDCVPVDTTITNVTDFSTFEREVTFAVVSPFQYSSVIAPLESPDETEIAYVLNLINMDVTTRTALVEMVIPDNTCLVVTPTGGTVVLNTLRFTVTLPSYAGTSTQVDVTIYVEDDFLAPGSATWPLNQVVEIYEQGCPDVYTTLFASTDVVPLVRMTGVSITGPVTGTTGVAQALVATVSPISATTPITYTWEATEQADVVVNVDAISGTVSLTWSTEGVKYITVTAENAGGSVAVTSPHTITISFKGFIYLPVIMRNT
jgi:immune inhibitor A